MADAAVLFHRDRPLKRQLQDLQVDVVEADLELDRELGSDEDLSARIRAIRQEAGDEAARRELDELKRKLKPTTLPAQTGQVIPVAST